ncbi:MAG: DinB family protein [Longimicrobiales bacterium]
MSDYAEELRQIVTDAAAELRLLPEDAAARSPAPGKWSVKEIIGHLIDSASNNHQRFVRAQFRADLRFEGYDQDEWVRTQRYQNAPWADLVGLWELFNLHLARFMTAVPDDVRLRDRADHNLDRLAWHAVAAHETTTLDYFMRDYVEHLKHHLRQVDELRAGSRARVSIPSS